MGSKGRWPRLNTGVVRRAGQVWHRLRGGVGRFGPLRARLAGNAHAREADGPPGVKAEDIIWIFCTARSGSTWLSSMMGDVYGCVAWNEPLVGALFGQFYYVRARHRRTSESVILGEPFRDVWLKGIRSIVLDGANARYPDLPEDGSVVVKEPNGSIGAPLLTAALPESRMVLLVRDPRDATASALDSQMKGGWSAKNAARSLGQDPTRTLAETDPDAFVERHANRYAQEVGKAKEAYDAHQGPKTLVRYEDLLADATGAMRRLYSELGLAIEEEEIARVIERHSWSNVPEDKKGKGKFYRRGAAGGWREDLTGDQARSVERITAPLIAEFYP